MVHVLLLSSKRKWNYYSECKNNTICFYDLLEKNIVSLPNIREGLLWW